MAGFFFSYFCPHQFMKTLLSVRLLIINKNSDLSHGGVGWLTDPCIYPLSFRLLRLTVMDVILKIFEHLNWSARMNVNAAKKRKEK